jgi:hypothetical protein
MTIILRRSLFVEEEAGGRQRAEIKEKASPEARPEYDASTPTAARPGRNAKDEAVENNSIHRKRGVDGLLGGFKGRVHSCL